MLGEVDGYSDKEVERGCASADAAAREGKTASYMLARGGAR